MEDFFDPDEFELEIIDAGAEDIEDAEDIIADLAQAIG